MGNGWLYVHVLYMVHVHELWRERGRRGEKMGDGWLYTCIEWVYMVHAHELHVHVCIIIVIDVCII